MTGPLVRSAAFMAVLTLASPAGAQNMAPCVLKFAGAADYFAALADAGWDMVDKIGDHADRLLWIPAVSYFGGDMGGEGLSTIVDVQRRAASNFGRLKALPTSETRVLTDGDTLMLASWLNPAPGIAVVQCRAAITVPSAPATETDGQFGQDLGTQVSPQDPGLSRSIFLYDRDAILAVLPDATPPDIIQTITHQYQVEVPQ